MKYPVLILANHPTQSFQFSVVDLPGCQVTSTSMDEGLQLLHEAITAHLNILVEYGELVPHAKTIDFHIKHCKEDCPIWALIEFDIVPYLGKSHKINVTLPELLIKQIDDRVNKSTEYKTRSGFIARACISELAP